MRVAVLLLGICVGWGCGRRAPAVSVDAGRPDVVTAVDVVAPDAPDEAPPDASPPRARRVTVTAGGDIVLTSKVVRDAVSHRLDGRLVWTLGPISGLLGSRAISFAHLRGPLTARPTGTEATPPRLGAPPEFARDLVRVGFDVVQVANDHSLDQSTDGLGETLHALQGAALPAVGAGEDDESAWAAQVIDRDGVRVGFVGFTMRGARGVADDAAGMRVAIARDDVSRALAAVTAAREHADVVVVGVHWAKPRPGPETAARRALGQQLIDAGADLVVGSGTNALEPVERVTSPRGDAVIAWSLGLLVGSWGSGWHLGLDPAVIARTPWVYDPTPRDGALLHVTFDLSDPSHVRVAPLVANAIWTVFPDDTVRVMPMRAVDERVRVLRMDAIGDALGTEVRLRP